MTDYQIVATNSGTELAKEVRLLLARGYKPLGGIAIAILPTGEYGFYQAVGK